MVLPQHWELVVSYGLKTLSECLAQSRGAAADFDPGGTRNPGEDAGSSGRRNSMAEEHGKARRGKAELDQQGDLARRGRGRELGGAGKYQDAEGNTAIGEIKKLQGDLAQEGESMDKNMWHVLSLERNNRNCAQEGQPLLNEWLEHRETLRRRRSPAGLWKRTESRWRFLGKREKPQRRSRRKPPKTTSRCQTGAWSDWMALGHLEGARLDSASYVRVGRCCCGGTVRRYDRPYDSKSVELERGVLSEDSKDFSCRRSRGIL